MASALRGAIPFYRKIYRTTFHPLSARASLVLPVWPKTVRVKRLTRIQEWGETREALLGALTPRTILVYTFGPLKFPPYDRAALYRNGDYIQSRLRGGSTPGWNWPFYGAMHEARCCRVLMEIVAKPVTFMVCSITQTRVCVCVENAFFSLRDQAHSVQTVDLIRSFGTLRYNPG